MSDPVVEAAQRAWVMNAGKPPYPTERELMEAAAREMAKSVQELHRPTYVAHRRRKFCVDCGQVWPCETAKRVYPSEDL